MEGENHKKRAHLPLSYSRDRHPFQIRVIFYPSSKTETASAPFEQKIF